MNYNDFVFRIQSAADTTDTDTRFVDYLPNIIDYGEQRCYRELDLLNTVIRDSSATVTGNSRDFTLPQSIGRFVVLNGINILTPVGTSVINGTRNRLTQISLGALDVLWQGNTAATSVTIPTYFAMVTDQTLAFGPPPGAAFTAEVIGTVRPTPLSPTNLSTYLTLFLPDLFFAACMVSVAGYQRDYGAQSDDPKLSSSWENEYQKLLASANLEEQRKRFASAGWQSLAPAPVAQQPR